jgi:hypothetical protein
MEILGSIHKNLWKSYGNPMVLGRFQGTPRPLRSQFHRAAPWHLTALGQRQALLQRCGSAEQQSIGTVGGHQLQSHRAAILQMDTL